MTRRLAADHRAVLRELLQSGTLTCSKAQADADEVVRRQAEIAEILTQEGLVRRLKGHGSAQINYVLSGAGVSLARAPRDAQA